MRAPRVSGFAAVLHQGDDGADVDFLADEGEERVRAATPARPGSGRLRSIAGYDPTDLFRLNQNLPPAPENVGPT